MANVKTGGAITTAQIAAAVTGVDIGFYFNTEDGNRPYIYTVAGGAVPVGGTPTSTRYGSTLAGDNAGGYAERLNWMNLGTPETVLRSNVATLLKCELNAVTFRQVDLTAGYVGTLFSPDSIPSFADLLEVTANGTAQLPVPPSAGNSQVSVVVWDIVAVDFAVISGTEYVTGGTPVLPAVASTQRVLGIYEMHDTDVTNADITTLFDFYDPAVGGGQLAWYSAFGALLTGVWLMDYSFLLPNDSFGTQLTELRFPTTLVQTGLVNGLSLQSKYVFDEADILNGVLRTLSNEVGIGEKQYPLEVTAATFAGFTPGNSDETTGALFAIPKGEQLVSVRFKLKTGAVVTGATALQLYLLTDGAGGPATSQMGTTQQTLAPLPNPPGFNAVDNDLIGGAGISTDVASNVYVRLLTDATFGNVTTWPEMDITVVTRKLLLNP